MSSDGRLPELDVIERTILFCTGERIERARVGHQAIEPGQRGALGQERRAAESAAAFGRATAIRPDFAEAHWRRGLALVAAGDYPLGWAEAEWRFKVPGGAPPSPYTGIPAWDGRPFPGGTLLVHATESLVSVLQYARYLPLAAARGTRLVLACPATTNPAPDAATTGDPAMNSPWSFTGLPTICLPIGLADDGLIPFREVFGACNFKRMHGVACPFRRDWIDCAGRSGNSAT